VADEGGWWPAFATNAAALDALTDAIETAGLKPGEEAVISLDVAASQFRQGDRYRFEQRSIDRDELIAILLGWIERYPIASIEDPLAEDDPEGWRRFAAAAGDRVQLVGDDLLVTNERRVRAAAAQRLCNAALIKPNQAGTVTEARAALLAAQEAGMGGIVSARSGETEDVSIAHLAVGWNAGQLKVGSFARSERMAKWNEVLRIEEALGAEAVFAGEAVLRPTQALGTGAESAGRLTR
jgi:enolase